jgi:tetratricopeptide (TPR) repeat protein
MNTRKVIESRLPKIVVISNLALAMVSLLSLAVLCACATAQEETAESWLKEGYSLSANGSYEQALQAYDKSIQIDPNNELAWINKANVLLRLNRTNEATDAYHKALDITNQTLEADPNNSTLWSAKGLLLHNIGNYEEAVRAFDNATNVDPNYEMAWKMKGVILASELHRYDEAVQAFDGALQVNPNDAQVWSLKGDALKASGRQAEADEAYAKARELGFNG